MTAPADRPADAELAAIERYCARIPADERGYLAEEVVPALIAEVRRLRAALAPLVAHEPCAEGGVYSNRWCCYCHMLDYHDTDCPWLAARNALAAPAP